MSAGELVQAVSTAKHKFDGVDLRVGDPFECTESELADLRVLGFAQRAPTRPKPEPARQELAPLPEPTSAPPRIEAEAVAAGPPAAIADDSTPPPSPVAAPQASVAEETRRTTRKTRVPT